MGLSKRQVRQSVREDIWKCPLQHLGVKGRISATDKWFRNIDALINYVCVCNIYINYTYVGCMCIYLSTQREKNIKCDKILIFEGSG